MNEQDRGAFRLDTVAIIGAGTAGRAFAFRCAQAGLHVVLEDVMPSKLRRAQDEYSELPLSSRGTLRFAQNVEDAVVDSDIALDFVPDELESKLEILSLLDRMAPPRTVLCTPTSALSITDLASCTYRPDHCLGLRWVDHSSVELIESEYLSHAARALGTEFFSRLGYATQVVRDAVPAMLTKRAH